MIKDTSNRREPVKVRTRAMKTGGASVYLDINQNGVRRQVRLNYSSVLRKQEKTSNGTKTSSNLLMP